MVLKNREDTSPILIGGMWDGKYKVRWYWRLPGGEDNKNGFDKILNSLVKINRDGLNYGHFEHQSKYEVKNKGR